MANQHSGTSNIAPVLILPSIRTVGDDYESRQFSTWSAMAIAALDTDNDHEAWSGALLSDLEFRLEREIELPWQSGEGRQG